MEDGDETPSGTRLRRAGAAAALAAVGFFFVVAPVVGDGLNRVAGPASPALPATRVATSEQVAAAGIAPDPAAVEHGRARRGTRR